LFSKSLVSQLPGRPDVELEAWRVRRLEAEGYPYLFEDAQYEKVRADRHRERGNLPETFPLPESLGVKGVELLVSDDHGGLKAAVARHIQGASWQRCQVHYARNLLGMVGAKKRKELAAKLRAIFAATSREQVLAQYPQEACVVY
jgi:putative transposase